MFQITQTYEHFAFIVYTCSFVYQNNNFQRIYLIVVVIIITCFVNIQVRHGRFSSARYYLRYNKSHKHRVRIPAGRGVVQLLAAAIFGDYSISATMTSS